MSRLNDDRDPALQGSVPVQLADLGGQLRRGFQSDPLQFRYLPLLTGFIFGGGGLFFGAVLRFSGITADRFVAIFFALLFAELGWVACATWERWAYGPSVEDDPFTIPIPFMKGLYSAFLSWRHSSKEELEKKGMVLHKMFAGPVAWVGGFLVAGMTVIGFSAAVGEPGVGNWFGCFYALPFFTVWFGFVFLTMRVGIMRMLIVTVGQVAGSFCVIFLNQGPYASLSLVGIGLLIVIPLTYLGWRLMGGNEM